MPEATEPRRSGPSASKALGPQEEASGSMAASEVNTNNATAEPSRMANPLKARKRTKTGCLSKFSLVANLIDSQITHMSQHAANGASSAARSVQPVKIVSSLSASAKAIFLESSSRTHLVPSGQRSKELLLVLNIHPIIMELAAFMGPCLQHPWTPQLRRVSFRMESKLG